MFRRVERIVAALIAAFRRQILLRGPVDGDTGTEASDSIVSFRHRRLASEDFWSRAGGFRSLETERQAKEALARLLFR